MSGALYVVYAGAALTGIMIAEAIYLLYAGKQGPPRGDQPAHEAAGKQDQPGAGADPAAQGARAGRPARSCRWTRFRKLRTQSGMTMPMAKFLAITSGVALGDRAGGLLLWPAAAARRWRSSRCSASIIPVQVLKFRRNRRHKIFGMQLPEALELITRSLKAGHPVPVAIAMVSREMPDPIGTEFGVVADEVTYGSDLVSALHNLYERVGQEDLPLFVTAVSIQSSLGRKSARNPRRPVHDDPRPRQAASARCGRFRPRAACRPTS